MIEIGLGIGAALTPIAGGDDPFNFRKALAGRYRIGLFGTSLAQLNISTMQKFKEDVRAKWGDAGAQSQLYGGIGGSYDNVYQGWHRQYFGGAGTIRLRGRSTSTPIREIVYGDQIDLFWSREIDAEGFTVTIDGISHPVGEGGAQAYGMLARFAVDPGPHELIITPPASGYCYIERRLSRRVAALGVEVEDFTLGGSTLRDAVTLRSKTGNLVDGIAIAGDNGIDALHGIPELDLAVITYTVNDAGTQASADGWVRGGGFATALGKLLDGFRAAGIPVIYAIEMAGHHIMPNDAGNANFHTAYNRLKADILAQAGDGVFVLDWDGANRQDADIAAYAAAYYPGASNLNIAAGTYSGDFIHPNAAGYRALDDLLSDQAGMPIPHDSNISRRAAARYRSFPRELRGDRTVTVDAVAKNLTAMASSAQPLVPALLEGSRLAPVFIDDTASTIVGATAIRSDIAASPNADAFGKYVDLSSFGVWGFATEENYWLTFKMNGNGNIRANGFGIRICLDGRPMPFTDPANGRTSISWQAGIAGIDEPILVAVQLQTSAEGQTLNLSGRAYDLAITRSDFPLLLAA